MPMGTVRVDVPLERIAVDLMGPMNETERFNHYIPVVAEWVCHYGPPITLHSDQGTNFESEVFRTMCELLDIKKTRTKPFRPGRAVQRHSSENPSYNLGAL